MGDLQARNFHNDLGWSLAAGDETFWMAVYNKAFPNLVHTELCTDLDKQKQGVDRVLYLSNGNVLHVDEKKRKENYPDILLEHTSNLERGTPGWIARDLNMDYLAYGFIPARRCYLFPWPMLRRAWVQYGNTWIGEYRPIVAKTNVANTSYTTVSVAVPTLVLQRAVTLASIIDVTKELSAV